MEKKDNVEKGVSGKPEEKKSAAYYEKRPEFGNRGPSKILLHFRKGITFFLVIAACVIFYFLLLRIEDISVGVSKVIDVGLLGAAVSGQLLFGERRLLRRLWFF